MTSRCVHTRLVRLEQRERSANLECSTVVVQRLCEARTSKGTAHSSRLVQTEAIVADQHEDRKGAVATCAEPRCRTLRGAVYNFERRCDVRELMKNTEEDSVKPQSATDS